MFKGSKGDPGENNKEYSYRVIKEGIMSLKLKPGQAISEIELGRGIANFSDSNKRSNGEIKRRTFS